jgi:hypothetical protein
MKPNYDGAGVTAAYKELRRAMNCLLKEPKAIKKPNSKQLAECDAWALHAFGHLCAAEQILSRTQNVELLADITHTEENPND